MIRAAALVVVAVFAALAAACGGATTPIEEDERFPLPGRIVYTRGADLWLRDADGGHRLIVEAEPEFQLLTPAFAPDGERIAYIAFRLTSGGDFTVGADLMLYDPNAGEPQVLQQHQAQGEFFWSPRWSADGEAIIVTHEAPDQEIAVKRYNLSIGALTTLRAPARDADIAPDGRLVYVRDPYGGEPRIAVWNPVTQTETVFDPDGIWEPRPYRIPRWSPDAAYIVFSAGQSLPTVGTASSYRRAANGAGRPLASAARRVRPAAAGRDRRRPARFRPLRRRTPPACDRRVRRLPARSAAAQSALRRRAGEFHGSIDWIGVVAIDEWDAIRQRVLDGLTAPADDATE